MPEPKKLKKPIPELRADLLADARTAKNAQILGMTTEAYVERVLHYAQNPDEQPVFNILPDDQVKAQGGSTVAEVKSWLEQVDRGEITIGPKQFSDGFESGKPTPKS
jgi:hypothetical protein